MVKLHLIIDKSGSMEDLGKPVLVSLCKRTIEQSIEISNKNITIDYYHWDSNISTLKTYIEKNSVNRGLILSDGCFDQNSYSEFIKWSNTNNILLPMLTLGGDSKELSNSFKSFQILEALNTLGVE